jgi:hypothetical protein
VAADLPARGYEVVMSQNIDFYVFDENLFLKYQI